MICETCGAEFPKRLQTVNRFCSPRCYWDTLKGHQFYIQTLEDRECSRQRMMGELNPMWKGGDSDKERRNSAYKEWRIAVFERDGFICRRCGYFNGCGAKRRDLNAHHIVPWIESIELRYVVENGATLCVPCHIREHRDA